MGERLTDLGVVEVARRVRFYEQYHHLPECQLQDLSYCLDCHAGVCILLTFLRGHGMTKYPQEALDNPIAPADLARSNVEAPVPVRPE